MATGGDRVTGNCSFPGLAMHRIAPTCLLALSLTLLPGCGGGPEGAMKDYVARMDAVSEALEKREPKEKVEALLRAMHEAEESLKHVNASAEEKKQLKNDYQAEIKRATNRMVAARLKYESSGTPVLDVPATKK